MSNVIDLTVDWNKGTIKQALARLPENMNQAAVEALNEGADFMKMMAKTLCPVDTGTLRNSIRKERGAENEVRVRAGGYLINPKTGRFVDYAHWAEFHMPYMRPAYEMTEPYIKNLIRQKVVESLL